jgi:hypothetical protein
LTDHDGEYIEQTNVVVTVEQIEIKVLYIETIYQAVLTQ